MECICPARSLHAEIEGYLRKVGSNKKLEGHEQSRLKQLIAQWHSIECEECAIPYCDFEAFQDWLAYYGYVNLGELAMALENVEVIDKIPVKPGIDALNAVWARRQGHFGG